MKSQHSLLDFHHLTIFSRFMFDDKDKDLPEWFVKEEEYHMRIHPDVDPEVVQFYKNR